MSSTYCRIGERRLESFTVAQSYFAHFPKMVVGSQPLFSHSVYDQPDHFVTLSAIESFSPDSVVDVFRPVGGYACCQLGSEILISKN